MEKKWYGNGNNNDGVLRDRLKGLDSEGPIENDGFGPQIHKIATTAVPYMNRFHFINHGVQHIHPPAGWIRRINRAIDEADGAM